MVEKNLLNKAKSDKVRLVELMFMDLLGGLKSVTIPVERLEEVLEKGAWFDGSSIEGFARLAESDMYLVPDHVTYSVLPWKNNGCNTVRVLCDVFSPNGTQSPCDPRNTLKKAVDKAKKQGFNFMAGPEMEFFLFKGDQDSQKAIPHDSAGYFDFAPKDLATDVRRDMIFALQAMGLTVETSHHEVGCGQHEINFKYADALTAADNVSTFKHVAKNISHHHGLYASFMPKPVFGDAGNGMHVHQSLFDSEGKNLFFDSADKHNLSDDAKGFIAGQLNHAKGMAGILCPSVNSYKRLVPGFEAPVYICWAQINRSALIRIPRVSEGREQSTRAELRCPDTSCNPYLALAIMLEAGLDGISKGAELPTPIDGNVHSFSEKQLAESGIETLPDSLNSAIGELRKDKVVRATLGEELFEKYIAIKKREWGDYSAQVTEWELKHYYESA